MTNHPTRRSFLGASLGAAASIRPAIAASHAAPRRAAPAKKRILILGGTGFLGPAIVEHALAQGHTVTLFNRGRTNADLFPELEQLRGDRNTGELDALRGREFDAVIDTSAYVPGHVTAAAEILRDQVGQYLLISSISVYPGFGEEGGVMAEDGAVATVPDEVVAEVKTIQDSFRDGGRYYGGFKALCEAAAEAAMPGRVANIRPGLIVGPRDNSDRFTWWPVRIAKGGEVLAPGEPDQPVQFIDARDLAEWVVHCAEEGHVGVYNATGFDGVVTMAQVLYGCRCATSLPVTITWADEDFLREQDVGPWMQMPLWIPARKNTIASIERAREKGLRFRPVADTIRDTLAWAEEESARRPMFRRTGLPPEREAEVLAAWHAR
ncbi:MAG: NAD-dependent epimerase/dehydratase family protein [Planctomycetota bacterium]|nr:NAD-dependent epimerase/dehydratase family protein [Planctomycetota bacterium]MDA0934257.1 NAD-dependent epimerase/dehydratase family protein [Planctomycetota bacterium]MDA1221512.1 NAD-dependent epimerase/dehydratase family protein [Planctomycetota bacterium]